MELLLLYIGLTLSISFLCSILEATLLSSTKQHLYAHHSKGLAYAKVWIQLKEDIDKPISAILSLNTIANTIGAIGVGSQVTVLWGSKFLGLASGIMTILILLFSEIVPKTLGARFWRQILPYTGNLILILVIIMSPFVFISNVVSKLISPMKKDSSMYREELHALASIGKDEGAFPDKEYKIISNLIHFNKILAKDIMTPRTVMVAVPQDLTLDEIYAHPDYMKFSRVPVFESNMDIMVGFILKSDLLNNIIKGNGKKTAKDIMRPIFMALESTPVPVLFEELLSRKEQISLIMDHYGGTSGVASLEDIIETLFGIEIMDELDSKRDMQVYARDKWRERAIKLGIIHKDIPKVDQ